VFTEADLDAYLASCLVPVGNPEPAAPEVPLEAIRRYFRPQGEGRRRS
jgi:hypothetical protein